MSKRKGFRPNPRVVYSRKLQTISPGVISEGTLLEEDLFEAFVDLLPEYLEKRFRREWEKADQEERGYILNEELDDELSRRTPPGYYFGAHPGDGACFGVWKEEEED